MKNNYTYFKLLKRIILFSCLFLFFSITIYAKGTVRGIISDAGDNVPLPAATVIIKGTSTGTISDNNGEYLLVLKAGTYILEYSYLGYNTQEKEIVIKDDEVLELDIALVLADFTGEEIVITAQARGQLAAVNRQINSDKVVSAVSEERIKEFPDDNAAQSISRLPGVHLSGSQVVIRGIQPKMNKILINGVEMPSTEENTRAVSLDMISSNMLSGIEVFKTVTPDMDADAIGGVVNLRLQEAQEGFKYSMLAQGNFNAQERIGNSKFWASASNRFLENRIGLSFDINYGTSNGGNDDVSFSYMSESEDVESPFMFKSVSVGNSISYGENYGGSFVADYALPNGKIIFNSMLTKKSSERISYSDLSDADNFDRTFTLDHYKYNTLLLNNSIQFDYQIGRVKLDAATSYINFKKHQDYSYNISFLTFSDGYYGDYLTNNNRKTMEPWELYQYEIEGAAETARFRGFGLDPGGDRNNEGRYNASINVEVPVTVSSFLDIKFKAGGKYRKMDRENDGENLYYGDQIPSEQVQVAYQQWLADLGQDWQEDLHFRNFMVTDYETNPNFFNGSDHYGLSYVVDVDLMDELVLNQMDYSLLEVHKRYSWEGDYWGTEELKAGYVMASINLWNKLLIIPGVRYESLNNNYSAFKIGEVVKNEATIMDTINYPYTAEHFLPHLHSRLKVTDWFDIRLSYNKTLSRPDFNYIVPKIIYSTVNKSVTVGSPYLKPAVSTNYDLNFSFHTKKIGLITLGGYTKRIEDMFFQQQTLVKNIPDQTIIEELPYQQYSSLLETQTNYYINNPHDAYLNGIELEWQSNLSWLPFPFNGLVLNTNYSHVWSETKYVKDQIIQKDSIIPVFPYKIPVLVEQDTFFRGAIQQQATDLGNLSIGYDYKGFSMRLSYRYQGNIINDVKWRDSENSYTSSYSRFDLALKQNLPMKFARMEVFFNAVNLTNTPSSRYQIFPNKGETITRKTYNGQHFQLGLRIRNKI